MFVSAFQRIALQAVRPVHAHQAIRQYSDQKNKGHNFILLGGGLGKLQGGIKEEEYFSSINQGLIGKVREHIEHNKQNEYLQNWDEYQKALNQAPQYNNSSMNKHKNCMEEVFFMNESSECIQILHNKIKSDETSSPIPDQATIYNSDEDD